MIKEKIINSQKKEGDLEIKLNQNIRDIIIKIFKEINDKLLKPKERFLLKLLHIQNLAMTQLILFRN